MGYTIGKTYDLDVLLRQADNGDTEAMVTAVMLMTAKGTHSTHLTKYISYIKKLAEQGNPAGYILLGDAYLQGTGVEQNVEYAIESYKQAVKHGDMFGYECIGMMYYVGTAVPQDYEKALHYLKRIKGPKSFCSLYTLGEMHRKGLFVTKNYRNACIYYQKIAYSKMSNPELDDYYWRGCFRLGQAYHYGMGVKKDLNQARLLISKAFDQYRQREENAEDISVSEISQEVRALLPSEARVE